MDVGGGKGGVRKADLLKEILESKDYKGYQNDKENILSNQKNSKDIEEDEYIEMLREKKEKEESEKRMRRELDDLYIGDEVGYGNQYKETKKKELTEEEKKLKKDRKLAFERMNQDVESEIKHKKPDENHTKPRSPQPPVSAPKKIEVKSEIDKQHDDEFSDESKKLLELERLY